MRTGIINASVIEEIKRETAENDIAEVLQYLATRFPGQVVFSSSFSNEDQVVTDQIVRAAAAIDVFTLDTGRLFKQTYSTWSATNQYYNLNIKAYFPEHEALETFLNSNGPDSFYLSVDNRKRCCGLRKVEPLKRALAGKAIWITGLRAEHSPDRQQLDELEWDEGNQLIKYHPLLHWSTEQVNQYIRQARIPYNTMHDQGFVSIGCEPCTRAIRPGEPFRAGRWWWEDASKKECGLHEHTSR